MTTATKNRTRREGATILTQTDLEHKRCPIPESWKKAVGILKGRRIDPLVYQRQTRGAWGKRLSRQVTLARRRHDS